MGEQEKLTQQGKVREARFCAPLPFCPRHCHDQTRRTLTDLLNRLGERVSFKLHANPIVTACLRQTVDASVKDQPISLSLFHEDAAINVMTT